METWRALAKGFLGMLVVVLIGGGAYLGIAYLRHDPLAGDWGTTTPPVGSVGVRSFEHIVRFRSDHAFSRVIEVTIDASAASVRRGCTVTEVARGLWRHRAGVRPSITVVATELTIEARGCAASELNLHTADVPTPVTWESTYTLEGRTLVLDRSFGARDGSGVVLTRRR